MRPCLARFSIAFRPSWPSWRLVKYPPRSVVTRIEIEFEIEFEIEIEFDFELLPRATVRAARAAIQQQQC